MSLEGSTNEEQASNFRKRTVLWGSHFGKLSSNQKYWGAFALHRPSNPCAT